MSGNVDSSLQIMFRRRTVQKGLCFFLDRVVISPSFDSRHGTFPYVLLIQAEENGNRMKGEVVVGNREQELEYETIDTWFPS